MGCKEGAERVPGHFRGDPSPCGGGGGRTPHPSRPQSYLLGSQSQLPVIGANPLIISTAEDGVRHVWGHRPGWRSHLKQEGKRVSMAAELMADRAPAGSLLQQGLVPSSFSKALESWTGWLGASCGEVARADGTSEGENQEGEEKACSSATFNSHRAPNTAPTP